jgi:hypothetical protein
MLPDFALASGGGPLILLFNLSVFVIGIVWIIAIESLIYWRLLSKKVKEVIWDVLIINIYSTLFIALGIPLLVAGLSALLGYVFKNEFGEFAMALGTWIYEKPTFGKLPVYMSFFWIIVLFVLTVYFEAYILRRRWAKRDFVSRVSPAKLSWLSNTLSYAGLLVAIFVIWRELFWL